MKPTKNIAILGSHISWDGGVDFLCFLVNGLVSQKEKQPVRLFLILPYNSIAVTKKFLLQLKKIISSPTLLLDKKNYKIENRNKKLIDAFINHGFSFEIIYYNYSEKDLASKLKKINADVIFPTIKSFGVNFQIPWLAYIPDLQHKHFPHFFEKKEISSRDQKYSLMLKESKALIVNSKAVKNDLKKLYNVEGKNIYNLPFTPPAPLNAWLQNKDHNLQVYQLPQKFFIISNQFWKHKSHLTAFEALSILNKKDSFKDVCIVCTGKLQDDRFPEFIEELKAKIKEFKVEDRIKFLGFIPKTDQIQIMKKSIAVIQPTLFEGGPGGGVVYNAVSMGIPCIISDIEINKEINEENVFFFKTGSAIDLANKMEELLTKEITRPDKETLIRKGNERTELLGSMLLEIIDHA